VIAENKHERLFEALLRDAAERSAININSRFAAGIVMAELQSGCAAERMPKHA
jgi:hypothetical protein